MPTPKKLPWMTPALTLLFDARAGGRQTCAGCRGLQRPPPTTVTNGD